jgi:regulator of sigma E protease
MLLLLSALAFFFLITGLILIHELGHFVAAKRAGVVVEEFGFGLPPRAKTLFTWRGTAFTFNWIPFGGFVRLKGENGEDPGVWSTKGSFVAARFHWKVIILVAGVTMNFLLALAIFIFGFTWGRWIPTYLSLDEMRAAADRGQINLELGVFIDDVLEGGSAKVAGVPAGSVLEKIDGQTVESAEHVSQLQAGKTEVTYSLLTGEQHEEAKDLRVKVEDGKTGIYLRQLPRVLSAPKRSVGEGVVLALRESKLVMVQSVVGIGKLFSSLATQGTVPEGITGIVGIAQLTYTSVQEGLMVYLRLVALLSLSLAILNILPFPALDGGRLLFVVMEGIFRRSNRKFELVTNALGFWVLLAVIVLVTLFDVLRLFRS